MPFKPGQSGNLKGKPKGALNGTTLALKEAILEAARQVGDQKHAGQGLVGYCAHLATSNETAFASLLGKVLPMQVTGEGGGPVVIITGVKRATDA